LRDPDYRVNAVERRDASRVLLEHVPPAPRIDNSVTLISLITR
jgi:hypothetical protein